MVAARKPARSPDLQRVNGRSAPRDVGKWQQLRRQGGPRSEDKLSQRHHQPHPNRQSRKGSSAPPAGRQSAKPPRGVGRRNGPKFSQNRPSQRTRRRRSRSARSPRGVQKRPRPQSNRKPTPRLPIRTHVD